MFSFAGIPNHYLFMNNPTSNLDSRLATYLRSAAFLLPAICLWMLASIYVTPRFNMLWQKSASATRLVLLISFISIWTSCI